MSGSQDALKFRNELKKMLAAADAEFAKKINEDVLKALCEQK